jgi:hypothetical protein
MMSHQESHLNLPPDVSSGRLSVAIPAELEDVSSDLRQYRIELKEGSE